MVDQPHMTLEPDGWRVVWDAHRVHPRGTLHFVGWVLLIASAAVILYDVRGWQFYRGPVGFLLPVVTAAIAALLINLGRGTRIVQRPLLRVLAGTDEAPPQLEHLGPQGPVRVELGELTHVVFGLIDFPWPSRRGIEVEAFALYLAKADGTPIPVIDGTMDKLEGYRVARSLSELLGLPLIELGKGT